VATAYGRARELCQQVGETPQLFPVLLGLSAFYMVRAQYPTARALGEQCLQLAQSTQDPACITAIRTLLGDIVFFLGEFPLARAHFEQALALYHRQQPRAWIDNGVGCFAGAAWLLWVLGYPDQALQRGQDALTLARDVSHPFSLGFAMNHAAMLHQYRREVQTAQAQAEAVIALSSAQGFPSWLANGTMLQGWALAVQSEGEEGITQLYQGMAARRAIGEEIAQPYFLALLAEAYGSRGQAEEGLRVLAEALATVHHSEERWWEAELYRLKGALLLVQKGKRYKGKGKGQKWEEAAQSFRQALAVARQQQAKSLELRAATSLARLWQQQGKRTKAYELLEPVHSWFTEGLDTADLQEAGALLDKLA
jgi:predicted ATPase